MRRVLRRVEPPADPERRTARRRVVSRLLFVRLADRVEQLDTVALVLYLLRLDAPDHAHGLCDFGDIALPSLLRVDGNLANEVSGELRHACIPRFRTLRSLLPLCFSFPGFGLWAQLLLLLLDGGCGG